MAYTNTDTNMTTSSALSAGMQTYYNRELLRTFEPNLVHLQFGDEHRMPPHSGLVMNMRKLIPLETNTKALSEGDPGESVMLAETEVTVQLQQYGEYARCTDKLDLTHLDMDIMRRTKLFGDAGARSIDAVVREELAKCANVIYAGGKASRAELTAADKLTVEDIRRAVRKLEKAGAPKFNRNGKGYYKCIIGSDAKFSLLGDALWEDKGKYQQAEQIENGEIGKLFGVIFIESSEAPVYAKAGASEADVGAALVFGEDAYGVVDLGVVGASPVRTIVKPLGSAGTADPLDQMATIGWKVDGFAAVILNQNWLVRVEHAIEA